MSLGHFEIDPIGEPPPDTSIAYFPVLPALDRGIVDEQMAVPLSQTPSIDLLAGRIPNYKRAGLVEQGQEAAGAFDFVGLTLNDEGLQIIPIGKDSVTKDGLIQAAGMIIYTTLGRKPEDNGGRSEPSELILAATVRPIDETNPWPLYAAKGKRRFGRIAMDGGPDLGVFLKSPLDQPRLTVVEFDPNNGAMLAPIAA